MGRALVNETGGRISKKAKLGTNVPNGPLIKKSGSSLKRGGKIKKAEDGRRVFPLDTKKGYRAKVVEKTDDDGVTTAKVKIRRTIGGFLSGKPRGKDVQLPVYNVPQREQRSENPERPKSSNTGNQDLPRRVKTGGKVKKKSIVKPLKYKTKKKK